MSLLSNLLKGVKDNPELIEFAAGLLLPKHPGEDVSELARTGDQEAISELDQYYETIFSRGSFWADKIPLESIIQTDPYLMLHYLSGSGEDVPLVKNQEVLDSFLQEVHDEYGNIKHGYHRPTYGEEVLSHLGRKDWSTTFSTGPLTGDTWDVTDFVKMQMGFEDESVDVLSREPGDVDQSDYVRMPIEEYPQWIWHQSENPEYPAEHGWEFLRYDPTLLPMMEDYYIAVAHVNPELHDIYNKLGSASTVRRRQIGPSKYEYQIVEPWDILVGQSEKSHGMPDDWETGVGYTGSYITSSRGFSDVMVDLASKYLPDFAKTDKYNQIGFLMDWSTGTPENKHGLNAYALYYLDKYSKPFDITGTSIVED